MIERNGDFTWTLLFSNNSDDAITGAHLADVFPYNGDAIDSDFSGGFTVNKMTFDFSSAVSSYNEDLDSMELAIATSPITETSEDLVTDGESYPADWVVIHDSDTGVTVDSTNHMVTFDIQKILKDTEHEGSDVYGFYLILGSLEASNYLTITIDVSTYGNNPGDVYNNIFDEDSATQDSPVTSIEVTTRVVERNLCGLAWIDKNADGIREDSENILSNTSVSLWTTDSNAYEITHEVRNDINGITLYRAADVFGETIETVTTDSNGTYEFDFLPAGTYYVVFENIPAGYGMTARNVGSDDTIDSDATGIINTDKTAVECAYIGGIEMPTKESMDAYLYESEHNDIGVVEPVTSIGIQKIDGFDQPLADAEFTLTKSDGTQTVVITDAYGQASFNNLGVGSYTLQETKAPSGYQLSDTVYQINVQLKDNGDEAWTATITTNIDDTSNGLYVIGNKSFTTSVTVTKVWNDNNNRDGKRTDADFTLTGTANGETVVTEIGTIKKDANPATYTWTDLPINYGGTEIEYTVVETNGADGYQVTYGNMNYSDDTGYSITVTNSYDAETTSLTIDKQWVDNNNATGLRPSAITVTLTGTVGNETVVTDTQTITAADGWTYTFSDLYVYSDGSKINYTITEEPVDYYETSIDSTSSGWTITNTQNIFPGEFVLNKVDDLGSTINGAQFTLTDNNGDAILFDVSGDVYTVSDTGTTSVINAGNVTIEMLMPGSYTLTEINAPDGYEGMSGSYAITVANDGTVTYSTAHPASLFGTIGNAISSAWNSVKTFFVNLFSSEDAQSDIVTLADTDMTDLTVDINIDTGAGASLPNNITLIITGTVNGETVYTDSQSITDIFGWTYDPNILDGTVTFTDIPVYSNGVRVEYTVELQGFSNPWVVTYYPLSDDGNGYNIYISIYYRYDSSGNTNISLTVTKVWDDNDDALGYRPASVGFELVSNKGQYQDYTLTGQNNWTYSESRTLSSGESLSLVEEDVPYYNSRVTYTFNGSAYNFTITNTLDESQIPEPEPEPDITVIEVVNHELTSVTVDKTWDDDSNRDGIRPTEITVDLYADGTKVDTATVTATDGWTYTFTDLPVYDNGKEITYTVTETAIDGYTDNVSGNADSGYTITNTHTPEMISVAGSKTWDDKNNQDGVRPDEITVVLYADGVEASRKIVTIADNWSYSFDGLYKYRDNGVEIIYTIVELPVDDYTTTVTGTDITNSYSPETVSISGIKTWVDNNDQDGLRPDSITVNLYADGVKIDSQTVTASNGWSYSFDDLDRYRDGGIEIVYTVTEDSIDEYTGVTNGTNFTNTHTPYTIDIPVQKMWNDDDDRDGIRPDSIDVVLTGSDGNVYNATLSADNDWSYTFKDLPVNYNGGTEIVYELNEVNVDGYLTSISKTNNGYEFLIENTHLPALTEVPVEKIWDDNDDEIGYRPEAIQVTLTGTADGEVVYEKTVTLTDEDDWSYLFENLFVYENGEEIVYTVSEAPVNDYYTDIDGNATDGYEITNTVIIPKLDKELIEDDYERKEADGTDMHPGEDVDGNGYGTWDDADNNEEVSFKLTLTDIKEAVNVTVHDYLTEGLDFEPDTVEVVLYDGEDEYVLTDGEDYVLTEGECTDPDCTMNGCTFELSFSDNVFTGISKDAYIIVTYKALTDTHADNYIGSTDEIYNEAYILYGASDSVHRTETVVTETDLFGFSVYKYAVEDEGMIGLYGAEFILSRGDMYAIFNAEEGSDGNICYILTGWTSDIENADTVTSETDGLIHIGGLDDDAYTLTEVTAPAGYYELEDSIEFTIDEDGNIIGNTVMANDEYAVVGAENEKILTEITGTKTWNDADDQDGIRPDEITVRLYADGDEVDSAIVTAEDDWTYTFTDLDAYSNGVEIEYTVAEDDVDGYTAEYDGYDIINTHEPETTNIGVEKVWDDDDDHDGIRPGDITIELTINGEASDVTLTLSEENEWAGTFEDLDVYEDGIAIEYGIVELDVEGYTSEITGNAEDGYIVTNTHEVTVEKTPEPVVSNPNNGSGTTTEPNSNNGTSTTTTTTTTNPNQTTTTSNVKTGEIIGFSILGAVILAAGIMIVVTVVSRKRKEN